MAFSGTIKAEDTKENTTDNKAKVVKVLNEVADKMEKAAKLTKEAEEAAKKEAEARAKAEEAAKKEAEAKQKMLDMTFAKTCSQYSRRRIRSALRSHVIKRHLAK